MWALLIIAVLFIQCKTYDPLQCRFTTMYLVQIDKGRWRVNEDRAFLIWEDNRKPSIKIATDIKIEDTAKFKIGMSRIVALPK